MSEQRKNLLDVEIGLEADMPRGASNGWQTPQTTTKNTNPSIALLQERN